MNRGISFKKKSSAAIFCFILLPVVIATLVSVSGAYDADREKIDIENYNQSSFFGKVQYADARKRRIYIVHDREKIHLSCGNSNYPSSCMRYNKNIDISQSLLIKTIDVSKNYKVILEVKNVNGDTVIRRDSQIKYIQYLKNRSEKYQYIDTFKFAYIWSLIILLIPSMILIKNSGEKHNV